MVRGVRQLLHPPAGVSLGYASAEQSLDHSLLRRADPAIAHERCQPAPAGAGGGSRDPEPELGAFDVAGDRCRPSVQVRQLADCGISSDRSAERHGFEVICRPLIRSRPAVLGSVGHLAAVYGRARSSLPAIRRQRGNRDMPPDQRDGAVLPLVR